jgi:hypothetical protein
MAKRIPGRDYYPSGRIKPTQRDYRAEEQRRNILAWAEDHGTRAKKRGKIERGEIAPTQPKRVRNPKTVTAQERRLAALVKVTPRSASAADRERCEEWSLLFAKRYQAEYHPEVAAELGVTRKEYTRIYMAAWIEGDQRYKAVRYHGGDSTALGEWMITLNGFYTLAQFEGRYGV